MSQMPLEARVELAKDLGHEVILLENGNGKIATVYGRVSGPKQAIDSIYSLKRQRGMADKAAEMNYSAIISIMADTVGVSGALGPESRPGFNSLCQLIERGIADAVFVMDFTRLVREKGVGMEFANLCIKNQTTIIDERGSVLDPNDDVGLMMYVLELTRSEGERNRINSRFQISRKLVARDGKNPGRVIPTGYYIEPDLEKNDPKRGKFKIYEPHRPFVEFVFKKFLELGGNMCRIILKACRENGFDHLPPFEPEPLRKYMEKRTSLRRSPRDESGNYVVTMSLISSIIRNYEWYIGIFEWGVDNQWGTPIRIEDNHTPIVDPGLQLEIQSLLDSNRHSPNTRQGSLPLAGLLWSYDSEGEPARLEYGHTVGNAPRYIFGKEYRQGVPDSRTWTLRQSLVDEPICSVVLERLVLTDYADKVAEKLEVNRQEALEAAERYRRSRERLETEIKALQQNFARVSHPDDVASIEQQLAERRQKLTQLAADAEGLIIGQQMMAENSIQTYREFLTDLPALWENASDDLKNRFLNIVLKGVYILHFVTYFDARIVWYDDEEEFIRVHLPPRSWQREPWTAEDDQYLSENYATASWAELAKRLNRKEIAIKLRAFNLGLTRKEENIYPREKWPSAEEEVLRKYSACQLSYQEMREALSSHNEESIYSKIKHMKLSHPTRPYWHRLPESYVSEFPNYHWQRTQQATAPTTPTLPAGAAACRNTTISCPTRRPSNPT